MKTAAKLQHLHQKEKAESLAAWEWHQDCLVVSILMASCFDQKTMKKLLARAGCHDGAKQERSELLLYAMHEACHANQAIKTAVSKQLNTKFRSTVQKIKNLTTEQIQQKADQAPWQVPLLWACYAHDSLEVRRAGREIAHLILWGGMKRLRGKSQVEQEKEKSEKLLKQNAELRRTLAEKQKQNKKLSTQIKQLSAIKAEPAAPAPPPLTPIKNEVKKLRRELGEQNRLVQELQHELAVWRSLALNADQGAQSDSDSSPVGDLPLPLAAQADCNCDCDDCLCGPQADCPLNGKTVAVIGGLKRLEKGYCQVIEGMGGQGLCHTGNIRAGARRLRQLVNKSDMVVYLTPVNSHGSLAVVKKQCKRCNTPFCPLNSTSPATLESHLREMALFF